MGSLRYYLSKKFDPDSLYDDYVAVYEQVRKNVDNSVFDRIAAAADKYSPDSLKVEKLLSILYLTTIAEENKEHAQVGKRIKRGQSFFLCGQGPRPLPSVI